MVAVEFRCMMLSSWWTMLSMMRLPRQLSELFSENIILLYADSFIAVSEYVGV